MERKVIKASDRTINDAQWLDIALFESARDNAPTLKRTTWAALTEALTRFRDPQGEDKRDNPCWSPTLYAPGARRAAENVISVSCLCLDYDCGVSIEEARAAWMDWPHAWHTSWSHTAEAPRFRIVLPLDRPIPADGWGRVFAWAMERSGGKIDPSTKDPSRLWFVPIQREACAPCEAGVHDPGGYPLEVDPRDLPPTPEELAVERARKEREASRRARRERPVQGATAWERRRQVQALLNEDPAAREQAASVVGARVLGGGTTRRAKNAPCPRCSRPSVWWAIEPHKNPRAFCEHRNSCDWNGWLDQVLEAACGVSIMSGLEAA